MGLLQITSIRFAQLHVDYSGIPRHRLGTSVGLGTFGWHMGGNRENCVNEGLWGWQYEYT